MNGVSIVGGEGPTMGISDNWELVQLPKAKGSPSIGFRGLGVRV